MTIATAKNVPTRRVTSNGKVQLSLPGASLYANKPMKTWHEFAALIELGELRTELFEIDGALAKIILDANNTANRRVSPTRVAMHKAKMVAGRFRRVPQGLIVGKDGVLYNGQHRLLALVEVSKVDPSFVAQFEIRFGEEILSREAIDTNAPRSVGDLIKMLRPVSGNVDRMVAGARMLKSLLADHHVVKAWNIEDYDDISTKFPAAFEWASRTFISHKAFDAAPVVGAMLLAYDVDPEAVDRFVSLVRGDGSNLPANSPQLKLRELCFMTGKNSHYTHRFEMAKKAANLVYRYMNGQSPSRVYTSEEALRFFREFHGV